MKKVLSLLVSFVFLQTQMWAHSGGPDYGGAGLTPIGTYGGVLIPEADKDFLVNGVPSSETDSIGLFTMSIKDSGPALGAAIVFVGGVAFLGDIVGLVDPKTQVLQAIVAAQSAFTTGGSTDPTTGAATGGFNLFAQGRVTAEVTSDYITGVRMAGTALIETFGVIDEEGRPIITNSEKFLVDGFQQSLIPTLFNFDTSIPDVTNTQK